MIKKLFLYVFLFFFFIYIFKYFDISYTFDDFKEYVNILLNASGMVFTLMGIWIAFLYPNALSRIVNPEKIKTVDFSQSLEETKRLESIVSSVLKSAIVVLSIMIIYLAKVIIFKQALYQENIKFFKISAVSYVTLLAFIQTEAIWHVIYSNIMFINDLHSKREDREADADI
jgi:hypothetical protein